MRTLCSGGGGGCERAPESPAVLTTAKREMNLQNRLFHRSIPLVCAQIKKQPTFPTAEYRMTKFIRLLQSSGPPADGKADRINGSLTGNCDSGTGKTRTSQTPSNDGVRLERGTGRSDVQVHATPSRNICTDKATIMHAHKPRQRREHAGARASGICRSTTTGSARSQAIAEQCDAPVRSAARRRVSISINADNRRLDRNTA